MNYAVDGIEKGKTIKSVQIINRRGKQQNNGMPETIRSIMVDYLDGTQDVFEFNEEILATIQNMVDTQAKTFVDKTKDNKFIACLSGMFAAFSGTIAVCLGAFQYNVLAVIVSALVAVVLAAVSFETGMKNSSRKKHEIYLSKIKGRIEEYNNILKKENVLTNTKNNYFETIINIDEKSIKELEYIGNKIERYNEIEGKTPKKKSL